MLEIRVLGELELRRGGRVLALPASKKSRALLGFLVVTAKPHHREALCELLWPGPDDPRAALRWSLTKLRSLVDEGRTQRLVADRERVGFEEKGCTVDLAVVRSLVGTDPGSAPIESLRRAAEVCGGELLEGLDLGDCYRYHEWCVAQREAVRALRVEILRALVQRTESSPEESLVHARARVSIDPVSEAAHVDVIRILGELGRKREALAQYETCRRILQVELGAKPSRALVHARSTLTAAVSETPEGTPGAPPVRRTTPAPLVGRTTERAELSTRIKDASRGVAQPLLLFVGEAGIGKTRLLDAAADEMSNVGGEVFRARAFEAERVRPYGPWVEGLTQLAARGSEALRTEIAPLYPELGSAASTDQGRLFDAVARLFMRAASRAPLLILLDDVQWFDEASTALLHALARSLPPSVLVVGAARPAELTDNPPAQRFVHGLLREGKLVEHPLAALERADVVELAMALGVTAQASRVFDESGGHPFFAVEIARALVRGDRVVAPSLSAMIDDRLGRLGPLARSLLPWAASMQRAVELDLLGGVTGLSPTELLAGVLELEERNVLTPKAGGYQFTHDLLRSAVYRKLSEPRRQLIHSQTARALAARDADAGEIAHHAALGGDHELAARSALAAGRQALRMFANREAVMLARFGIDHAAALAPEARLPLQVALLDVVVSSRTWHAAAADLEQEMLRVIAECERAGLHEPAASALHVLAVIQHDAGTPDRAFASSMRAASVTRTADPAERAERLAATAKCLTFLERDMASAHVMLEEAKALAKQSGREMTNLHWAAGLMHAFEGDAEGAALELSRVLALARRGNDRFTEFECSIDLVLNDLERERPREALERATALRQMATTMTDGSEAAMAASAVALARLALGEPEAEARVLEAVGALRAIDAKAMLAHALSSLASAALDAGRPTEARDHAQAALHAATAVRRPSDEAAARVLLARASLALGDRPGAMEHLAPVMRALEAPLTLGARVQREARAVATALGMSVPTPAPTTMPTAASQVD